MKVYLQPERNMWPEILQRPKTEQQNLHDNVMTILNDLKTNGDKAVKKYTSLFDEVHIEDLVVSEQEIEISDNLLSDELKQAIHQSAKNIKLFHSSQIHKEPIIETMPGVKCWRKLVAIQKVGLYIPGGSASLFSTVLMLAIPATMAGCSDIIVCSPPDKNGFLHPAILYAAKTAGVTKIFKVGGAQAIGAMAYGTETISSVYKIFGPGNQYVTTAKQLVQQHGTAIDMPAGPSEVLVLADETADASFIAADLLSQAEHGPNSQCILVALYKALISDVQTHIENQLRNLSRKETLLKALNNCKLVFLSADEAIDFINDYAPEHLIICCKNENNFIEKIYNAGSVFIGNNSPESAGDYASGTNHTLPTNGFAKAYSGVSIDSFVKKITYQQLSAEGLQNISPTIIAMAEAEGLQAHAQAVKIRLKQQQTL